MFTRLMFSYLLVTLAILGVISIIFINLMQKYFFSVEGWQLAGRVERAVSLLHEPMLSGDLEALTQLAETLAFSYDVCLWVTDREGAVLAESGDKRDRLGLRVEEFEIGHVLDGNTITKQIVGPDYNSLLYIAPIFEDGERGSREQTPASSSKVIGALAISSPLGPISGTIAGVTRLGLYAAIGAAVLAAGLGFTLSRNIAHPLEEMSQVALELSRGNFENRVRYRSRDELGQLAQTLNFAIAKVAETIENERRLVKQQRDFVSDISHEFRAPLTSLRGFLELFREGKIKKRDQAKYLDIIYHDAMQLSRLVQDLLDLASLESGQLVLSKTEHEPGELLRLSLQHLELKLAEKEINLDLSIAEDLPVIAVDEGRFRQVLHNLAENAIHFSPPRETITVRVERRGQGALFMVSDCGAGIPAEELPYIWNRFYKVDKVRTRGGTGTGLGLAIVRQIVELHGGWVAVESNLGGGSTFSFWLPSGTPPPPRKIAGV
jgi:signal transduction histidine kinase